VRPPLDYVTDFVARVAFPQAAYDDLLIVDPAEWPAPQLAFSRSIFLDSPRPNIFFEVALGDDLASI